MLREILPSVQTSITHSTATWMDSNPLLVFIDDQQNPEVLSCLGCQCPKLLGPDERYGSKACALRLHFTAPQYHAIPPFVRSSLQYLGTLPPLS